MMTILILHHYYTISLVLNLYGFVNLIGFAASDFLARRLYIWKLQYGGRQPKFHSGYTKGTT